MRTYPIDALLPQLCELLVDGATVLLQAPPGAGKTTRVPLALINRLGTKHDSPPFQGRIWIVEPRRLAARAAAKRLAESLDQPVGQLIGYSIRGEQLRSESTQVEIMTDGLFLRRLQADPSLDGVGCVVFDEFHERRRDAELSLTLLREARSELWPDLCLLLMSATLDLSDLKPRLPEAIVLKSEGRCFPVETHHQLPKPDESLPRQVLRAVENHALSLPEASGVLVFLPGLTEINRCLNLLRDASSLVDWEIHPLHGDLSLDAQHQALGRCKSGFAGKLILASAIAESSLTLDGVCLVIDSGLSRQLRYDPTTGMEGLETVLSSLASADQRQGRAGRQGPGCCVRLWSPANQQRRPAFSPPELQRADPQPIVLELAAWGAGLGEQLPWLEPPPAAALQDGRDQLTMVKVLLPSGRLSATGKLLNGLSVHPRLGILMLEAWRCGNPELGCDLAALLSDRDPLQAREVGCDLNERLQAMHRLPRLSNLRQVSRQLMRQLRRLNPPQSPEPLAITGAELILNAFPQWLALKRQGQRGTYLLRQGRGARLLDHDPLIECDALAVARVDNGQRDARIHLAFPLDANAVERLAEREGCWQDRLEWDAEDQRIRAERVLSLGPLLVRREAQPKPSGEHCRDLLLKVLRESGRLDALPWSEQLIQLRYRLDLAHRQLGRPWPRRDLGHLMDALEDWLGPALEGCYRLRDLDAASLETCLWGALEWQHRHQLDQLLPTHLPIPSGRSAALRYDADDQVVLAVKLQEMFGCGLGPCVLNGRLPVTLELLSPAGRPLQRTRDLAGFWAGSYLDVRREMRGRYPKHPWPQDPLKAVATASTKERVTVKGP